MEIFLILFVMVSPIYAIYLKVKHKNILDEIQYLDNGKEKDELIRKKEKIEKIQIVFVFVLLFACMLIKIFL